MAAIVQGVRAELVTVQGKVADVIALVDAGVGNLNEDQTTAVVQALDALEAEVATAKANAFTLLGQPAPAAPAAPTPVTTAPTVTVTAVEGAVTDAAAKIAAKIEALKTEADAALAAETKPTA